MNGFLNAPLTTRKWMGLIFFLLMASLLLTPGLRSLSPDWINLPATNLLTRLQGGVSALSREISGVWTHYLALVDIRKENQNLSREVIALQGEIHQLQETEFQNRRLQALLDFHAQSPLELMAARVIGRDSTNWFKTVTINKGLEDGLENGMPVITPAGVVGKIARTATRSSRVLLMLDPRSIIAARVQGTRDEGLVEGLEHETVQMSYLPVHSEIRTGEVVLTSGLAGIFPPGLVIGSVTGVHKKESGLFQVARIRPVVNFGRLEEVLVVTQP